MAGIKEASVYNHFTSKMEILQLLLAMYEDNTSESTVYAWSIENYFVRSGSPAERICSFLYLRFPEGKESHYQKILFIVLHEQHRNPTVREFVMSRILRNEMFVEQMLHDLMDAEIIETVDAKFVARLHVGIVYRYSNTALLTYGGTALRDTEPTMFMMLTQLYDTFIKPKRRT
jgi:AcrR family transcriptional regulator